MTKGAALCCQGYCLLRAEAAHHLHRRALAHALENRRRHIVQVAALSRAGSARRASYCKWMPTPSTPASSMRFAVSIADPVGPCIGIRTSAKASLGIVGRLRRLVAHGAHRSGRRLACKSEEVDDVGAAAVDRVRFALAAIHGLHIGKKQCLGKRCRKIGTTLRTPSYFRSGVPSSTMVTPAVSAASAAPSPCGTWGVSTEIWNVNLLAKQAADAVQLAGEVVCHRGRFSSADRSHKTSNSPVRLNRGAGKSTSARRGKGPFRLRPRGLNQSCGVP